MIVYHSPFMLQDAEQGFTLIELLVVIAIIGVLAAIAIPQFTSYRTRTFDTRSLSDLRNAATAEEAYYSQYGRYVDCLDNCAVVLPGMNLSPGVKLDMFQVPANGTSAEHFTGRAYHQSGRRNATSNAWMWNSNQGGLVKSE